MNIDKTEDLNEIDAKQGRGTGRVRLILAVSLTLAIIAVIGVAATAPA